MTSDAFQSVLQFVYSGKLGVTIDSILDIHAASKLLLINEMSGQLRSLVMRSITSENVFAVGAQSYLFDDPELQLSCEKYVCHNFSSVLNSAAFHNQPVDVVEYFLASDDVVLPGGETQVLNAILGWIEFESREQGSQTRVQHFERLLECVRFDDMSRTELETLATTEEPSLVAQRARETLTQVYETESPSQGNTYESESDGDSDHERFRDAAEEDIVRSRQSHAPRRRHSVSQVHIHTIANEESGSTEGPRFRVTNQCLRNIRFDFVIHDVLQFREAGQVVCSPWYKCGPGLAWRMEVYPRGTRLSLQNHVSVFLRCSDENSHVFQCSANFSIFVLEQSFGMQKKTFSSTRTFSTGEPCWGRSKFVRRSELQDSQVALQDDHGSVVFATNITW